MKYDSKLLIYQLLTQIPCEVLMLEVYRKIKETNDYSYLAMALLNLGVNLGTLMVSRGVYDTLHKDPSLKKEDKYYTSFFSDYMYHYNMKKLEKLPYHQRDKQEIEITKALKSSPSYSETYWNTLFACYGLKAAYSTNVGRKNKGLSVFKSIAYGLTQPLAVVLDDEGKLKG